MGCCFGRRQDIDEDVSNISNKHNKNDTDLHERETISKLQSDNTENEDIISSHSPIDDEFTKKYSADQLHMMEIKRKRIMERINNQKNN